jgi:uncharacterized protein (DUF433 family)
VSAELKDILGRHEYGSTKETPEQGPRVHKRTPFDRSLREQSGELNLLAQVRSNYQFLQDKLSGSSDHIRGAVSMNPGVLHGNPVFLGTRLPLYTVIDEIAEGTSIEGILEAYPSIKREQLKAGLEFASDLLRIYDA